MNPLVIFFMAMTIIGLVDKFFDNKLGLGEAFDNGNAMVGDIITFVAGVCAVGTTVTNLYSGAIAEFTAGWSFDPSVLIGSILCTEMGSYTIAVNIAHDDLIGRFAGFGLGSTLGTLVAFYLPTFMAMTKGKDIDRVLLGFLYGIVVLPLILFVTGLMFGIESVTLIKNMLPVVIICGALLVGLIKAKGATVKILHVLGRIISIFTYTSFGLIIITLFLPNISPLDLGMVEETVIMVFKMCVTIIGALVTMQIVQRVFAKQLTALGKLLGVNEYSMMGLIIGMPGGIAMIPLMSKMDNKGKILNGAFAVSGFYVFGGQMAFIATNEGSYTMICYFVMKFLGGILALLLANKLTKSDELID